MLLLVAIRCQYPDDEFTCVQGELLRPTVCGRAEDCETCGARFAGIATNGITSTALLTEMPITRAELVDIVRGYAHDQWHAHDADLDALADDLLWPGRHGWPIGTILQRDPRPKPMTILDPRDTARWKALRRQMTTTAIVCAICGHPLDHHAPARSRWRPP